MGMFDLANIVNATQAAKQLAGTGMQQTASAAEANAYAQDKVATGNGNALDVESLLSNPAITHGEEKATVYAKIKARMRASLDALGNDTLIGLVKPAVESLQKLYKGLVPSTPVAPIAFDAALSTLERVQNEIANSIIVTTADQAFGYVVDRITDLYFLGAKAINFVSATLFKVEAPIFETITTSTWNSAHLHVTQADSKIDLAREEIHKVAEAYGLEAKFLMQLIEATATLKVKGLVETVSEEEIRTTAPKVSSGTGSGAEMVLDHTESYLHGNVLVQIHSNDQVTVQAGGTDGVQLDLTPDRFAMTNGTMRMISEGTKVFLESGENQIVLDSGKIHFKTQGGATVYANGADLSLVSGGGAKVKLSGNRIDLNPGSSPEAPTKADIENEPTLAAYGQDQTTAPAVETRSAIAVKDNVRKAEIIAHYQGVNPQPFRFE